ncbi:hypothetical protein KO561_16500 [Radiobacillus kanasensis]|uniref:hypothetical protein n=1 Tax=Radiobacillus kanasensis TaxID=2844358 RepID=UPI001E3F9A45|nr:hypothetical protein [Radiobacillus kanasensis]UFT98775.1 hypothetical protein KO561_16500 [Radiobacillus kanasensis]
MDIHQAYKQLGVSENATEQEIEYKFEMWIKKHHSNLARQGENEGVDIELITSAYETIKKHKQYVPEPTKGSEKVKDKLEHFFRYYKLHTFAVIVLVLILYSIIQAVIDHQQQQEKLASLPPVKVEVMFFGSFLTSNFNATEEIETTLAENILAKFPSWKRVSTTYSYSPQEVTDQNDIGYQQKSAAQLATEKPDMYVMNLEFFKSYVQSGMFYPLDQMDTALLEGDLDDRKLYTATTQSTSTEHLYGIELTDAAIFSGIPLKEDTRIIAAIRKDAKNKNNALQLMLEFSNVDD